MNQSDQQPSTSIPSRSVDGTAGVSRRRLMRAGLSAAPVLAAFKANSVLATTGTGDHDCIKPSSFASISPRAGTVTVSQGRNIKADYQCKSHGYWKNNNGGLTDNYKNRKFLGSNNFVSGFTANPNRAYTDKSFQWVLNQSGNDNFAALARHIVAAYLSAVNASDVDVILTKAQCNQCWNALAGGASTWSPFAGANWDLALTMRYFDTVFGPRFLP